MCCQNLVTLVTHKNINRMFFKSIFKKGYQKVTNKYHQTIISNLKGYQKVTGNLLAISQSKNIKVTCLGYQFPPKLFSYESYQVTKKNRQSKIFGGKNALQKWKSLGY